MFSKKESKAKSPNLRENASFQRRLQFSFLYIALPVIIVIAIGFFFLLRLNVDRSIVSNQESSVESISNQLGNIIDDTKNISHEILYNSEVQSLLTDALSGERYPDETQAAYYINNFISEREYIKSIILTSVDHTVFSSAKTFSYQSSFSDIEKKWWFNSMTSGTNAYGWYAMADAPLGLNELSNGTAQDENNIVLARPIYSLTDYKTKLGYEIIYLDGDYINQIWESCDIGNTTNIMLFDESGNFLATNSTGHDYSDILSSADENSGLIYYAGYRYVYSKIHLEASNMDCVMITPYEEVNDSLKIIRLETLFIILVFILVLFFLSRTNSANIARPIIALSRVMDSYQGNKDDETDMDLPDISKYDLRSDEIGQIFRSFEEMKERINSLINEVYITDLEKKDAQLALLQSQINPHFLYNTLDSINWVALENDQDQISEMVTALSDLFRLSLTKDSSSYIELSHELNYVESYLTLQKIRYEDKLNYIFNTPSDIKGIYVPKFILQPLVENALKHASSEDGGGIIEVNTSISWIISIEIINGGCDIDLDKMKALTDFNSDKNFSIVSFEGEGYGVRNINRRIKILCGNSFGLTYTVKDNRTICHLTLPLKFTND